MLGQIPHLFLAAHAGRERVEPGEIVMVQVDVNLANELSAALAIDEFLKIKGADRILNPSSAVFVPDHFTPNKDIATAKLVQRVRRFALDQNARWFEVGRAGIEHCVLPHHGIVGTGQVIIRADSHTSTSGAIGACSTGVGLTAVAVTSAGKASMASTGGGLAMRTARVATASPPSQSGSPGTMTYRTEPLAVTVLSLIHL